ncbi:MAG: type I-F CRISPR-associated protein Csy2 [Sedimenticola sp.]
MSQYLILSRVNIQKANCIAGFTWGFPAITHFAGFTHALQRKLSADFDIAFSGCAVVSHYYQAHVYKPTPRSNYEFIQSKNPAVLAKHKTHSSPPIIEEGKMNLTASIIVQLSKELATTTERIERFKQVVMEEALTNRLAGGSILSIDRVDLLSASTEEQTSTLNRRIKRLTMPGFVLQDRSDYLMQHFEQLKSDNPDAELLGAWLDFSARKFKAIPKLKDDDQEPSLETDAVWEFSPKPAKGWLVPIMVGYKAISEKYSTDEVGDLRVSAADTSVTDCCFVEAVHSVGEWKSMHRISDMNEIIWRYQHENDWYLCAQAKEPSVKESVITENEILSFEDAIANL